MASWQDGISLSTYAPYADAWLKTRSFVEQFNRGSKYVELSPTLLPSGWTARCAVSPLSNCK